MSDCSATYDLGPVAGEGRRKALVLVVAALLVAGAAIATYAVDPDLSGLRPSYGSGIDPGLGSRVAHDFLADQDAEAKALSTGDQSQLENHFTGNALQDVAQQITSSSSSVSLPTISFQPQSLSVIQARDPNDPSVVIEVQEDGVKTLTTSSQNAAPSEQTVNFHGNFWMRESNGRYAITDQAITNLPASPLPNLAVVALALLAVGLAALLVIRRRSSPSPAPVPVSSAKPTAHAEPAAEPLLEAIEDAPQADLVVRTFGGLHLIHRGKDLVQALVQRPVTGFAWQRLLVGAIRDPTLHPLREDLARQVSPAMDRETQLKRMRNLIYHGFRELPAPLRDAIRVEPQALSFKLEVCEVDAVNLMKVAAVVSGRATLAPADVVRVQRVYDQTAGTFLPDFEKVEDLATVHHPTCTDLVREVRELLLAKRLGLALVLADTYLAGGRPAQAIAVLEPALREREKRKDLADRLVAAYRTAGRDAEATSLEERFA
jgi:hypothetical protein